MKREKKGYTKNMQVYMHPDMHKQLKIIAFNEDITMSEIIRRCVQGYFDKLKASNE